MAESQLRELFKNNLQQMDDLTEKQKKILQAALALFAEQGFEATTSAQIAKRAGVAVGSVYQHFHNKKELLLAVLTPLIEFVYSQASDQFIDEALAEDYDSLEEFIRAVIANRTAFIRDNQAELKIALGQVLCDRQLGPELQQIFAEHLQKVIFPIIDRLKAKKLIVDYPDSVIFQFMMGPLAAYFGKNLLAIKPLALNEEVDNAVNLLVNGLSPRK